VIGKELEEAFQQKKKKKVRPKPCGIVLKLTKGGRDGKWFSFLSTRLNHGRVGGKERKKRGASGGKRKKTVNKSKEKKKPGEGDARHREQKGLKIDQKGSQQRDYALGKE